MFYVKYILSASLIIDIFKFFDVFSVFYNNFIFKKHRMMINSD